jgi:2-amino-4-hydroxy-6-hydroxymethyldihydropteridine diphosphokinase
MARVFVGIGSNIDREHNIGRGLALMRRHFGELLLSGVYRTKAVGFEGEDFFNLVAGFDTELAPDTVVRLLRAIETTHDRSRSPSRFSARSLDLDLLLYGDLVRHDGVVDVPRADIVKYAFVLEPLAEIAADLCHPETGERFADLWARFDRGAIASRPARIESLPDTKQAGDGVRSHCAEEE